MGLERNNIHAFKKKEKDMESLDDLRKSPSIQKNKVEFILVTDGLEFQAGNIITGETIECGYKDFHNYFVFSFASKY